MMHCYVASSGWAAAGLCVVLLLVACGCSPAPSGSGPARSLPPNADKKDGSVPAKPPTPDPG